MKLSGVLVVSFLFLALSVAPINAARAKESKGNLETSLTIRAVAEVEGVEQHCASIVPVELLEWADGKWRPSDTAHEGAVSRADGTVAGAPIATQELRVLTFNIWFSDRDQDARTAELLRILAETDADVVALQEVTDRSAADILRSPVVQARYLATSPRFGFVGYGTMTLVAHRLEGSHHAEYCHFGEPLSRLGRGLLRVDVARGAAPAIPVGNVHLESPVPMVTADQRAAQLRICSSLLRQPPVTSSAVNSTEGYILMGDFNFISEDESVSIGENDLVDCWTHLKETSTPTFDYSCNQNIKKHLTSRPDRITCSKRFSPQSVELVGKQPIPSTGLPPSDHFGLLATLKVE